MKNASLIDSFLEYLDKELCYSKETIRNYEYDVLELIDFFELSGKNFLNLSINDVRDFLKILYDRKLSSKSISRKISSCKCFFCFLEEIKCISHNVFLDVKSPKLEKKLPNFLTTMEIEDLLLATSGDDFFSVRNYLLIEIMYSCGLRVSEIKNLLIKNINFDEYFIKISGKGNKERIVLFGDKLSLILKNYLNNYRGNFVLTDDEGYLLISKNGTSLSVRSMQKILKNCALKAGILKNVSPHCIRHSFATDLLRGGASIESVKTLLGHDSLKSTEIYTHVSNDLMKDVYLKTHNRRE